MNIIKHARFINESVAFRLAILTEMFFSRDTSQISIERTICNLKLLIQPSKTSDRQLTIGAGGKTYQTQKFTLRRINAFQCIKALQGQFCLSTFLHKLRKKAILQIRKNRLFLFNHSNYFTLLYTSSDTGSNHSGVPAVIAMCSNQLSFAAPCQCFTPS